MGGKLIHEKNQTQKINVFRSLKILALENYDCGAVTGSGELRLVAQLPALVAQCVKGLLPR